MWSQSHRGFLLFFILWVLLFGCTEKKKQRLKIGDQAPSFSVEAIRGGQVSLDAYKGSPVILRFWTTDCKYCRADTPIFNQYFEDYKNKGLKVVYVNTPANDSNIVKDFIADLDIKFPVILDKDGKIAESYTVKIVPQTIILNPEHKIITGILGGVSEAELQELLGPFF